MPSYNTSHFDPPAPVVTVSLFDPKSGAIIKEISLLLDSGADVTLLSRGAVERLGVAMSADEPQELVGFDGSKSFATVASLDMIFLRRAFRGRYPPLEQELGILGRDILDHSVLLLDGPAQNWSQHSP
jgi:hypothetical protein